MAIRARSDNLSLDIPAGPGSAASPAPAHDFTEVWAQREALRHACVRLIGDPARAEDLVQDTFMSALKCSGRFRENQPVAPWLKTVARRRSIDELRGRDRVTLMAVPPEPIGAVMDDPADHVVNQELVQQLRRAIGELSPRERQLLLRQASYGLSLAELAAEEDTSIASVRSVLSRARQKLRSSLERGGVFGSLPLPRYLATLRERLVRWSGHLEPTLPAMTVGGARLGEVFAAVVTALAMLLTGGGSPSYPIESLVTTGLASADSGLPPTPGGTAGDADESSTGGGGQPPTGSSTLPSATPLAPLPPEVGKATVPSDGTHVIEDISIDSFAASSDGQTILAGGPSAYTTLPVLFRSVDGGQSWTRISADEVDDQGSRTYPGGQLFVPPDFPTDPRVFAVADTGIWKSEDAGATFSFVGLGSGMAVVAPDFGAGDDRLFATAPTPVVYDDEEEGVWPLALLPPPGSRQGGITLGPDFASSSEVLIGGFVDNADNTRTPVVHTCVAGACSERATVPAVRNAPLLLTMRDDPDTVFAWSPQGFARSTDGGSTFTAQAIPSGIRIQGILDTGTTLYRYGSNPFDRAAPLYRSDDGGDTWTALAVGTVLDTGIDTMLALPNGHLLAAHITYGIYCSTDQGATWTTRCPASP